MITVYIQRNIPRNHPTLEEANSSQNANEHFCISHINSSDISRSISTVCLSLYSGMNNPHLDQSMTLLGSDGDEKGGSQLSA